MIGWIDAASGASGDMLLGALIDAGADSTVIEAAIAAVAPEPVEMSVERVQRGALRAQRVHLSVADSLTHRGLGDVMGLLASSDLDRAVVAHAKAVFAALGEAEAEVHGVSTDEVHFHEVGALDAIADIVGVCAGFVSLGLDELHCSPVAVGSGSVSTRHGLLSVPPPAVVLLLRGIATYAGPAASELCTPTGAALLAHWVTAWGGQPVMVVRRVGTGAGAKDFASHPNVVRLLVGDAAGATGAPGGDERGTAIVLETNVDDLDPRLWPTILQLLLDAGASDAWLTPIMMKKGRPAHTLSVLVSTQAAEAVRQAIFAETPAIGLRESQVSKTALGREFSEVTVDGQRVSVKVARSDGVVVNVQPEYDDVAAAAVVLERPVKAVLADAIAAATRLWMRKTD